MSISMNSQSALHEVESRCTQERPPRCQSLCPLGLDARAFLGHAAEGRWSDARKQLERYLPLPGLLARVCDHPCEQGCLRGDLGGAVNLHGLEIFCTEHLGVQTRSLPMPRKQKRIAVIGAGLAGLVCAWDLAGKGYPVTVFHEGDPKAQLLSCWPVLAGAGAAAVFVVVYISFMGYAGDRVTAWRHPELDPGDTGYQILQSLYAIGSGGLFGLGLGKSRQKYLYLPFQYNDYIFAIACEELGLMGAVGIMVLFTLLILRGFWIARQAQTRFSTALAAGLISLIAVQTILNLCVVTNLLPSTGIALPFFSYGGTALAVNLGEMGIVLNISRKRTIQEANT